MKKKVIHAIPEFKISLKKKGSTEQLYEINNSETAAEVCRKCFDSGVIDWKEEFIVIVLNNAKKMMGFFKVSSGGITSTVVDTRVIFQLALTSNATAILLCHNHPSGNITPSHEDRKLTQELVNGGNILRIQVIDHIIITSESFYSFSDNGLI